MKSKKGISLVEVLIAVSLFAIVSVIATTSLFDIVKNEKRSSLKNALYSDLRAIMQTLTYEIQNGTIDYEEYYNYNVIQKQGSPGASGEAYYGLYYGVYGSRFYDPGRSLGGGATSNPHDLGVECSYPKPLPAGEECEVVYTLSLDLNSGQHPYTGLADASADAFCDDGWVPGCLHSGETDQLFLIDNTGTKKTILARKKITGNDYAIGMVKMEGRDLDQNGLVDTFSCMEGYKCFGGADNRDELAAVLFDGYSDLLVSLLGAVSIEYIIADSDFPISVPQKGDLDNAFLGTDGAIDPNSQFMPITPLRSNIKNLKFIVTPLEDPYKAYSEVDMQKHPSVTILLTIDLSEEAKKDFPGDFEPLTVQTTVSAGVIGKIDTYPPLNDIRDSAAGGWMGGLVPSAP